MVPLGVGVLLGSNGCRVMLAFRFLSNLFRCASLSTPLEVASRTRDPGPDFDVPARRFDTQALIAWALARCGSVIVRHDYLAGRAGLHDRDGGGGVGRPALQGGLDAAHVLLPRFGVARFNPPPSAPVDGTLRLRVLESTTRTATS